MDPLTDLLIATQRYLNDEISTVEFQQRIQSCIRMCNVNELRAFADVISTNAIHLRERGH